MKIRVRRILGWGVAVLVLAFIGLCLPFDPPRYTADEIRQRVDLLNEKAAIETPHHQLGKKIREENLALFEKVEQGKPLSEEESVAYRELYQAVLKQKQHELSLLDRELTVLTDYQPQEKNNVGSLGIAGSHDHHDASAGANLAALRGDLERMEHAGGINASYIRVREALNAWKDLDDVILHMATAPQTKSVPRVPERPTDALQAQFEELMAHFKNAQFAPVNSPLFITEVHAALDHYDSLVAQVQDRIYGHLGPVERSLAGRWGSWRSLAPSLESVTTHRIGRS